MPQPPRNTQEKPERIDQVGAATTATAAAATAIPPTGAVVTAATMAAVVLAAVNALRHFWRHNSSDDIFWLMQALKREYPAEPESQLQALARKEAEYGLTFLRKMEARLERDIPAALAEGNDPEAALRVLMEREQRYIKQRQEAMLSRSMSTQERESLKRTSPYGAYWRLSPFVKEHTIDCLVMGGKFWPWAVLDEINPPRHPNCPCRLYGLDEAKAEGFLPANFVPPPEADGIKLANELKERFAELQEAVNRAGEGEIDRLVDLMEDHRVAMNLLEAPAKRFPKGTVKGGEFMPKTGGFAAAVSHDLKDAVGHLLKVGKGRGRGSKTSHGLPHQVMHAPVEEPHVPSDHAHMPGGHGPEAPHRATQPSVPGTPPNFHQFRDRVGTGVKTLADQHGTTATFKSIDANPNEPDTMGQRWSDGRVELGQAAPGLIEAARANPEDADAQSGAHLAYSRAAHEAAGHSVNPISTAEYATPDGRNLEEALAEETGRDVGHDWMREDGLTGAADWAAANPDHPRAIGAYRLERERLAAVLDEAGVAPGSRRGVMEAMAFHQKHPARMSLLGGLVAKKTGMSNQESRERVRATLTGERDDELQLAETFDSHPRLPILQPRDVEVPASGSPDTGGEVKPPETSSYSPEDVPAPESGPVTLQKGSGDRFFDARHYSDPRRSLLRKMAALKPGGDDQLKLADGSVIAAGPNGSMRMTRPDGGGKLYSTPQRLANAETAGVLSRHGITGDRLAKARTAAAGIPNATPAAAEFESSMSAPPETLSGDDLAAAMTGAGEILPTPRGNAEIKADDDGWSARLVGSDPEGDDDMVVNSTRHGLADDLSSMRAPAEDEALNQSLAEKPPAAVLGVPSYQPELSDFKAAGGSNGAQFASDGDGQKWLVKNYKGNEDRVATELLANAVYRDLGIAVPNAGKLAQSEPDFSTIPDEPIDEPPLPELPKGKKLSSGMVIRDPKTGALTIFEPKNHFGGYKHTFSKGRVEDGLTPQQNARKELHEEMGMHANPYAVLGDYEGDQTVTRYYMAHPVGGRYEPPGGETESGIDGVKDVSPEDAAKMLNRDRDKKVLADAVAHPDAESPKAEDYTPGSIGKGPALGYPLVDGKPEKWAGESQPLGEGFMADALLGNWDVVGLSQDNVLWDHEGNPVRVDQGGTFEYRAMGQKKPFGPVPTEAWTMRSPRNGQAFGRMALNDQMLKDQAGDIAVRLTPERIDKLVDEAPFKDEAMRERIRGNLKQRVAFMGGIADGTEELPGPLSGSDADAIHAEDLRKIGGLYPEEEGALEHVLNSPDVNDGLRSGQKTPENQKTVEKLDALFKQARSSEDTAVYVPTAMTGLGADQAETLRGKVLKDDGYVTASTDPDVADSGKALMRILIPAGAPALSLGELGEPGAVLLNRGQSIRIAGSSEENGRLVIDAVLTRR